MYGGVMPVLASEIEDYWYALGSVAVAGGNTDASEFLRFLDWLGVRENYTLLFYGEENTDYTLSEGKIVPMGPDMEMLADVRADLFFLERSDFKAVPLKAPWNLRAELQTLEPSYTASVVKEGGLPQSAFSDKYGDTAYSIVMETYREMLDMLFDGLFDSDKTAPDKEEAQSLIDQYAAAQRPRDMELSNYAALTGEIVKAAIKGGR
jgi:hypothetical protein